MPTAFPLRGRWLPEGQTDEVGNCQFRRFPLASPRERGGVTEGDGGVALARCDAQLACLRRPEGEGERRGSPSALWTPVPPPRPGIPRTPGRGKNSRGLNGSAASRPRQLRRRGKGLAAVFLASPRERGGVSAADGGVTPHPLRGSSPLRRGAKTGYRGPGVYPWSFQGG